MHLPENQVKARFGSSVFFGASLLDKIKIKGLLLFRDERDHPVFYLDKNYEVI